MSSFRSIARRSGGCAAIAAIRKSSSLESLTNAQFCQAASLTYTIRCRLESPEAHFQLKLEVAFNGFYQYQVCRAASLHSPAECGHRAWPHRHSRRASAAASPTITCPCIRSSGAIKYQGQPIDGAFVSLHPKSATEGVPNPRATVAKDGSFTVSTYNGNDGAPEGDYIAHRAVVQAGAARQRSGRRPECAAGEVRVAADVGCANPRGRR